MSSLTRDEVARHGSESDCWVIHGYGSKAKVYDVTKFLGSHPGGADLIVNLAGKDMTDDFEGTGHSDDARAMLNKYYLGDLVSSTLAAAPGRVSERVSGLTHRASSPSLSQTEDFIKAAAGSLPSPLVPYIQQAAPALAAIGKAYGAAHPHLVNIYAHIGKAVAAGREHNLDSILTMVTGFGMCFFGGAFTTTIATVEAFNQTGWTSVKNCALDIRADLIKVKEANDKDAMTDDDGDGVADVKQISGHELFLRKARLLLITVDPSRISNAIAGLVSSWVAVLAVLRIQFAKAITLGSAIGESLRKPASRFLAPAMKQVLPPEYHKWIDPSINYACKCTAISIAWMIQRIISAFHSAVRGGQIFAKGLLRYLEATGRISPINMDETYVDEVIQWSIALIGFYFQFSSGFSLSFPLNVLLLPFTILEYMITWAVVGDV